MVKSKFGPLNWFCSSKQDYPNKEVVDAEEVFALLSFAVRNKISSEKVSALSEAIRKDNNYTDIAKKYSELVNDTYPITGRTILDSKSIFRKLGGLGTLTILFFLLAAGNHVADAWLADIVQPDDGYLLYDIKRYVWDYLTPFFWGCLGSCVFLMKKIQDLSSDFQYEHTRLQGWFTRILLGGIIGAIFVSIVDVKSFGEEVNFTVDTLAFLAGLGVKIFYNAFESIIDSLSNKLKIADKRQVKDTPTQDDVSQ